MNYRLLGRTGMQVSEISLGSWLTFGNTIDQKTATACVTTAFDNGINLFDTADAYAAGQAEEVMGKALKELPRNQIVIATKLYFRMWPGPLGMGLSRKHVVASVEGSLRRLGVDYIDLYQTHVPDADTPVDETLRALDDLRRQGKILHAGCSNYSAAEMSEALLMAERFNTCRFDCLQPEYSMLAREIEEEDLPFCARNKVGVICYSPLAEGVLTGKYNNINKIPNDSRMGRVGPKGKRKSPYLTAENLAKVRKLQSIARKLGCSTAQMALTWVLANPTVTSAIIGASRPEQVVENTKASGIKLDEHTMAAIDKILA